MLIDESYCFSDANHVVSFSKQIEVDKQEMCFKENHETEKLYVI